MVGGAGKEMGRETVGPRCCEGRKKTGGGGRGDPWREEEEKL